MSGVLTRFPLLLPVRNSFASYGASAVTRTRDRELVDYGNTPNNAYSQGVQELNTSAGVCLAGSLANAQVPAVACPPRTLLCDNS